MPNGYHIRTLENTKYKVTFSTLANQTYGFDMSGENPPAGNYNQKIIAGKLISVPWKSIENGRLDKLGATIEGKPADSVFFARESASMVMIAKGTNEGDRQLMIKGQGDSLPAHQSSRTWSRAFRLCHTFSDKNK